MSGGYDTLNRLTSASATSGVYQGLNATWTVDSFGNRTSENFSGTLTSPNAPPIPASTSAIYSPSNQVQEASGMAVPTYDTSGDGDVTNDGQNQYLYVGVPVDRSSSTGREAEGTRVAKGTITSWNCNTASNGFQLTTSYILTPGNQQLTELAWSNGTAQWAHTNVWGAGQLLATYSVDPDRAQNVPGILNFFFTDMVGTRTRGPHGQVHVRGVAGRVMTDYAGNVMEACHSLPYGNGEDCAASPTEHLFTGKERDSESGNDYFGARYYASTMGRFLSPDWAAKAEPVPYAKLENPQTLNLYAYVGNNPLIRTDPTGHYVCSGSKEQCAQIQDGLNAAKAAQAKLGADSKEGKAIGAVLKFYGAAGEKNGVNVSFGNLATGTLGETSAGAHGSINIKFDLKQIDSFGRQAGPLGSWTERSGTEIHEGRHGEDFRAAGHGPENRHEEMQTERNAYRTQSYVYQGLGVETPTGLWSPSWSPAAAEQNRNAAVQEGAERSTNAACAQGCQP